MPTSSIDIDDARPPPLPAPPANGDENDFDSDDSEQEGDTQHEGIRVFGEGDEALNALKSWANDAETMPPLRHLDLRYCDAIDGAALSLLGPHARGLVSLRLDGCRNVVKSRSSVSGQDDEGHDTTHSAPELSAVLARSSRSLRSLSLYWIPRLPRDVVYSAAAACGGLTSLNLSGCTRAVDDGALLALATSLGGGSGGGSNGGGGGGGLRRLDLTRCQRLTDKGMSKAFSLMPRLRELRLYAVESFGDEASSALASCGVGGREEGKGADDERASKLEIIDVCGARDLSDDAASELVRSRCSLRVLGCGWVPNVGDSLAKAVAECCASSIESLSFHGNKNLSDQGFDALVLALSRFKKIKALDVRGCVGVSESKRTKEALREAFGEQLTVFALQR